MTGAAEAPICNYNVDFAIAIYVIDGYPIRVAIEDVIAPTRVVGHCWKEEAARILCPHCERDGQDHNYDNNNNEAER